MVAKFLDELLKRGPLRSLDCCVIITGAMFTVLDVPYMGAVDVSCLSSIIVAAIWLLLSRRFLGLPLLHVPSPGLEPICRFLRESRAVQGPVRLHACWTPKSMHALADGIL